jgi:hypothetical protein
MIEAGLGPLDQLERVWLVPAAEKRATSVTGRLGQAELDAPAGSCLFEIRNTETDVIYAAEG